MTRWEQRMIERDIRLGSAVVNVMRHQKPHHGTDSGSFGILIPAT
jgi:hypothetical protein